MLVQVPLPLWTLETFLPTGEQLHATLTAHYDNEPFVQVMPLNTRELRNGTFLDPMDTNGTNTVQIFLFANDTTKEALLVARLDNLGKGASGAAVQNLNLMLGCPENSGLPH